MDDNLPGENLWTTFHYDNDGGLCSTTQHSSDQLDPEAVESFLPRLNQLSGTLQLPLKTGLAGERAHLSYEMFNESTAAYVLYYVFDDVVAATLIMSGENPEEEHEVLMVFRYQLLEESDNPDPSEEYIEKLLSSADYDFESQDATPASFAVTFAPPPGHEDDLPVIAQIDLELTAAFLALTRA